jgi:2-dehydropantoate 2-reductase
MKVCVFGAGATGGHFAVLLARAGAEVSVVVRGANLAAIAAAGITLRTDDGPLHAAVRASDDAHALGVQDLVLVTLKSHALPAAAEAIGALLGEHTSVVFVQNGIPWWYHHGVGDASQGRRLHALDPGDALWNAVGPARVIGGVTSSACTLAAPGIVEVRGGNRKLSLGEPDGSDTPRLQAIAALFREAGFPAETTGAIRDAIWAKLALNLGSGPLGVLAPVPLRDMFAEQVLVDARTRIQAEVAAIAEAMGCTLHLDVAAHMAFVRQSAHLPSIAQDAAAGRKLEIEAMFCAPLRMARDKGVATPTLDLLVALCTLKARAAGLYP